MDWEAVKRAIGFFSVELVPEGGIIGLGSGSTSQEFIKALSQRYTKKTCGIQCVGSSIESEMLAKIHGLPVLELGDWVSTIDVAFDGADAVDEEGTAIKGAGGALVREKIVLSAAKKRILMIDERKWKKPWKECLLPVAIVPFGATITCREIQQMGMSGSIRKRGILPFLTNDGNFIFDVTLPSGALSLDQLDKKIKQIPGVVDTGIFFHIASEIVIGYGSGNVEHKVVRI